MKNVVITVAVIAACFAAANSANADLAINNTSTAGWSVDRYAPNSFVASTAPDSQAALATTISSAQSLNNRPAPYQSGFYNTQGYQQAVNGTVGSWMFSENLYVTAAMLSGATGPLSSELWGGTGNGSGYYCMTFLSGMNARSISAIPSASSQIGVFDDTTGAWSYFSTAGMNVGWNKLSVAYNGTTVDYAVNGNTITSQGTSITSADPNISSLSKVYLEDYNQFGQAGFPAEGQSTVYRKDITALTGQNAEAAMGAVPEPSTVIAGAIMLLPFGFGGVRALRRRFSPKAE